MKKNLRIFLIVLLLVNTKLSFACIWGPYAEDLRVFIFNPATYGSNGLAPFYYTGELFYSNPYYENETIPDENIEEWYNYLDKNVDKKSIIELVYHIPADELRKIIHGEASNNDTVMENVMAKYIINSKREDILDYILPAKEFEELLQSEDPWSDNILDYDKMQSLIRTAKAQADKTTDTMLKQRYAYQVIVAMRYAGYLEEVIKYYDKYFLNIKPEQQSILKYWALSHKASCEMYLGKKEVSQLNFLKVFMESDAKKFYAGLQLNQLFPDSLLNTKPEKELIRDILIYKQFRNPGKSLEFLKTIMNNKPKSNLFIPLIVRELNKIEDWLLTRKYTGNAPAILFWKEANDAISVNYENDFKYLQQFINFIETKVLISVNSADKAKIQLILAHLYFLHEEPLNATKYLNLAKPGITTTKEQIQYHYTKILVNLMLEKEFGQAFETKLWDDINWLSLETENDFKKNRNFSNLFLAIHQAYHQKKMYAKAALYLNFDLNIHEYRWQTRWWDYNSTFFYLDDFASSADVQKFVEIVIKPDKNELEKFLLDNYSIDIDRYYDLMGTIELRNNNFETALKFYEQVAPSMWLTKYYYSKYLSGNPFASEKAKPNYMFPDDSAYVDKVFFVKKIIEAKSEYEVASGEDKVEKAILLSNVYFNLSRFGTHWHYCSYAWSNTKYGLDFEGYNHKINDNYHNCTTALEYLSKAFEITQVTETKAKILFIQASIQNNASRFEEKKTKNIYAKNLLKEYPDEYDFFIEECPGLKYF